MYLSAIAPRTITAAFYIYRHIPYIDLHIYVPINQSNRIMIDFTLKLTLKPRSAKAAT